LFAFVERSGRQLPIKKGEGRETPERQTMHRFPPPAPAAGTAISDPLVGSKYRVVRRLGSGGWGTVFEAEHLEIGRRFAVKMLRPGFASDPMLVERMRVEARALGRLQSPHVVEACDFGYTEEGRPFLVMPLLVGHTLSEELAQRAYLPPTEAVELVQQLLSALDVAHQAGLVHRDIKLDNLFLCDDGAGRRLLKLLDFGIAKVLPDAQLGEVPGLRTQDGTIMGTPRFIPPEQATGSEVGPSADLYGAGIVLYELLTGRDPFQHVTGVVSLLKAHVSEDAPVPSAIAPQFIEPVLDAVVMRALAKRPQDRYASAAELSAALRCALEGRGPPRARRDASLALACTLVVASAVLSALVAAALVRGP
jgi:serine/threonine-protein kinase